MQPSEGKKAHYINTASFLFFFFYFRYLLLEKNNNKSISVHKNIFFNIKKYSPIHCICKAEKKKKTTTKSRQKTGKNRSFSFNQFSTRIANHSIAELCSSDTRKEDKQTAKTATKKKQIKFKNELCAYIGK